MALDGNPGRQLANLDTSWPDKSAERPPSADDTAVNLKNDGNIVVFEQSMDSNCQNLSGGEAPPSPHKSSKFTIEEFEKESSDADGVPNVEDVYSQISLSEKSGLATLCILLFGTSLTSANSALLSFLLFAKYKNSMLDCRICLGAYRSRGKSDPTSGVSQPAVPLDEKGTKNTEKEIH
jgi:hypothetical protein